MIDYFILLLIGFIKDETFAYAEIHLKNLIFEIDSLDIGSFYTAPEIPEWIWLLSSGILLFIISVAIVSNVTIIIAYYRTKWVCALL